MIKASLIAAIQQKKDVVLTYHGYTRSVEPHCLGEDSKGELKLRCWQTAGGSESGERSGWKLLNVSEVHSASMSASGFAGARPGYKRDDTAMRRIYAQL